MMTTQAGPEAPAALSQEVGPERLTGPARVMLGLARIGLGLMFLWTFVDALVGIDFPVPKAASWLELGLDQGHPANAILGGASGPLADYYGDIAGSAWADWVLMVGLALAGVSLVVGVLVRIGALYGGLLLLALQGAALPPLSDGFVPASYNPVLVTPIVLALVLLALVMARSEDTVGLGKPWGRAVAKVPFLK